MRLVVAGVTLWLLLFGSQPAFAVDPPTVSAFEFVRFDEGGNTWVRLSYHFPGVGLSQDRKVHIALDGSHLTTRNMPAESGTDEFVIGLWCLTKGFHQLTATPESCGFACQPPTLGETAVLPLNVTSPRITNFAVSPNSQGQANVTVGYEFFYTRSSERRIDVFLNGALVGGESVTTLTGAVDIPISLGCKPSGSYPLEIVARSCGRSDLEDRVQTTIGLPARQGVVSVNHQYDANSGERRIFGSYTLPPNTSEATLLVQQVRTFDESGSVVSPAALLGPTTVTASTGTFDVPFTPPTDARQVEVQATLTFCNGRAEAVTSVPCDDCHPPTASGDPVSFVDGNMRYTDLDPLPRQLDQVALTRTYDTYHRFRSYFGRGWWSLFDARLVLDDRFPPGDTIALTTTTNESAVFVRRNGTITQLWPRGRSVQGTLTFAGASSLWVYRPEGSLTALLYRASDGRFAGIRQVGTGRETRVQWSAAGLPQSVTDSWTQLTWTIATDSVKRRITSITIGPLMWTYEYDASDNLQRVLAPEGALWRTYQYSNDRMTQAQDGSGDVLESHTYSTTGAATSSTGPSDEIESIAYDVAGASGNDTITRVTMKTGAIAEYLLRPIAGAYRTIRVTGGCSSCGAHDSSYVYDDEGHLIREQDATGYVTVHEYTSGRRTSTQRHLRPNGCDPDNDSNRCRLHPDTLSTAALTSTGASLTTTYAYDDPRWPDKVTRATTPSVRMTGEMRDEEVTYHSLTGVVRTETVRGWTGNEPAPLERGSMTAYYGDFHTPSAEGDEDTTDPFAPAFDPGSSVFTPAWLSLPQPPLRRSVDGPRGDAQDVTSFVYYPIDATVPAGLRGRLAATRNAAGHITRFESYDAFGNVTRLVDPNGVATEMTHDVLGRLKTSTLKGIPGCDTTKDALCSTDLTTTRTYKNVTGPLEKEQRPGGGFTSYTYDTRGRVSTISRGPSDTDLREQFAYEYDAATGLKSAEIIRGREDAQWVEKKRDAFTYNAKALLVTITHSEDDNGSSSVAYTYDDAQRLASVRDENHSSANTFYTYDPAGRVASVRQTLSTAPGGTITTRYTYDVHGNLRSVADPNGNVTQYTYDDFGQLVLQTPFATMDELQRPIKSTRYKYDEAGNLTLSIDPNNAVTQRAYDALGRIISARSARGSAVETVAWVYDDATAGRFGIGRLTTMIDPAGSTKYSYERRGLLREEERGFTNQTLPSSAPGDPDGRGDATSPPPPQPGPGDGDGRAMSSGDRIDAPPAYTAVTKFTYDRDGNRSSITYPSSLTVHYTFDYAGRPLTASNFITSASYLPYGPLTELRFANNTRQEFDFDKRYRMKRNELKAGNDSLFNYAYQYDAVGNIVKINEVGPGGAKSDYDRRFDYDDLHRLITADTGKTSDQQPGGPPSHTGSVLWRKGSYTWDAMGNILTLKLGEIDPNNPPEPEPQRGRPRPPDTKANIPRGRSSTFTYVGTTPLLATVTTNDLTRTVQHDAAGNETEYFVRRDYSPRNLLERVIDPGEPGFEEHTVTYAYDGRGIRAIRGEGPNNGLTARRYYVYSPELQLLAVTADDLPNVWESSTPYEIVWFGDRPVGQITPGGFPAFTVADHLGTPFLQTNANGVVTWRVEYEPFGNVFEVREGKRTDQPLRFPGQEVAMTWEGPEENYNIARWYKAGWGRYTQVDPVAVGTNTYLYGSANPSGFVDPLGLFEVRYSLVHKPTIDPEAICGSPIACSRVGVAVTAHCRCDEFIGRAVADSVTLIVSGDIQYYAGPIPALRQRAAVDPTVVDRATAIAHEYNFHIRPSVRAVIDIIAAFELRTYESIAKCRLARDAVANYVERAFIAALRASQADEHARRGR